jgi:hypothetical protein
VKAQAPAAMTAISAVLMAVAVHVKTTAHLAATNIDRSFLAFFQNKRT